MSPQHSTLNTIPNRFAFIDAIGKDAAKHSQLSLMLVDVVRFSDVTTSFGMEVGDQFLLEIVNRILTLFKGKVRVGRISGDIFGLVFEGKHSKTYLYDQYLHLVEHFKAPMYYNDHAFIADFNVGAVSASKRQFNITQFVGKAEAALKNAKENQYENYCLLEISDKADTGRSLALKADLKRALSNGELELYLQPKVDLKSLTITSAECLLRWNHPLDGVLFPGPLIEAAESYNMINELGIWTLQEAFKIMNELMRSKIDICLSVNISPTQLYDSQLVSSLQSLTDSYHIPLDKFELEITEDMALSNSLMVKKQLSHLHALGVSVAVDDFGKGYSNLSYIRDLTIQSLKIDKTFVMELESDPVNSAIIEATQIIGKAKQCEVVAEGVETMAQLHKLRELNVPTGQGFLFSPAIPLPQFIQLAQQEILVGTSPQRKAINN